MSEASAPPRPRLFLKRTFRAAVVALAAATLASPPPAQAQSPGRILIRDAEIEALLRDYSMPVLGAAKLRTGFIKVAIIGDRSFNAFVADGQKIFVNAGALIDAKTPNELIGVLAHETGHLAGGHLARLRQEVGTAQMLAIAGMLLGGAAVAGAAASGGRVGNAGTGAAGIFTGTQELVRRNLLSYQRGEEQAADRAALNYLAATQQSPKGMLTTFKRFADNALFTTRSMDPYLLSHPLPQERIANLEDTAKKSPYYEKKDSPALQARHDLMRAKLIGFMERPETVARAYPPYDNSAAARYARAISNHRNARTSEALRMMDELLREQPGNPYFWELKGQMLLESGRARESIPILRKAVSMAPSAGLIQILLGHALVSTEDAKLMDEAIRVLSGAAVREPEAPEAYRHLSTAYARKNNIAMAEVSAAQYFFNSGQYQEARQQADRAKNKLPVGSPSWLKAEQILDYRPPKD